MALILDHVSQGFVTVDFDGALTSEGSRPLARWFGAPPPDARVWTYLAGHDPEQEAWMQLGFESLASGLMAVDVVLAQLPTRLVRGDRQLHLEYRPIGEPVSGLLIVASDVTDEVARQRALAIQGELFGVIERASRDRAGCVGFVRATDTLLATCADAATSDVVLRRELHTLKGNFALFGLPSLAERCHQLETQLDDGAADRRGVASIGAAWHALRDQIDTLLGGSERRTLIVDWDAYQTVLAATRDLRAPWLAQLRRWGQDPTRAHLERLSSQARHLAQRLDRAELDVEIRDHDLCVEGDRFAPLWAAIVHAVRNAIDHGIETTDARVAAGKPARARLTLTTERLGERVGIELADDGAGIDWRAVARKAAALGLPASTARELHEALFADGLSTASAITSISGRGIGLSALRAICVELGGDVEVESTPGCGTTVRCVVPITGSRGFTTRVAMVRP